MTTISEFMQNDHSEIDMIFSRIAGGTDRMGALGSFAARLKIHIRWEEDILFPLFERATGMNGQGPTEVMRDEHKQILELLSKSHDHLARGKDAGGTLEQLRCSLKVHNDKEENVLYPCIDDMVGSVEREDAIARMSAEKDAQPAHKDPSPRSGQVWKTSIADSRPDGAIIRGYKLADCIEKLTFSGMAFLLWTRKRPSAQEARVFDAMLVACAEHGIAVPSVQAARVVMSGGNPMNTALAAGILACGDIHGGAIEACAKMLSESKEKDAADIVREYREQGRRMPGFGHKIYADDPRTATVFRIAQEQGILGDHVKLARALEAELERSARKRLCLNVDGAVAALMCDMGIDWRYGKGFFALARSAGLVAHIHEESTQEKPFRRVEDSEYIGEDGKDL